MFKLCYSDFHKGLRRFGVKPPLEDTTETHGICPTCLPLELARIRHDIKYLKIYLTPHPKKGENDNA